MKHIATQWPTPAGSPELDTVEGRLRCLEKMTMQLAAACTTEQVVNVILQFLPFLHAATGILYLSTGTDTDLKVHGALGLPEEIVAQCVVDSTKTSLPITTAIHTRHPVVLPSLEAEWERYSLLTPLHAVTKGHSLAAFPLIAEDRILGAITMTFPDEVLFSPETLAFLQSVLAQGAIALERARLYDKECEHRQKAVEESKELQQHCENVQRNEERLRLAIEGADIGTWHWNLIDNTMLWSSKCHEMLGTAPEVPGSLERFLNCIHPDDRKTIEQRVLNRIARRTGMMGECRIIWPDDTIRWIVVKGRAFYDQNGNAVRAEGILLDVTRRKQAENLSNIQRRILKRLATDTSLTEILREITELIEMHAQSLLCSILLLDNDGKLHTAAAPNFPPEYLAAIEGIAIGPNAGSCGTAAFYKERVITTDIATDPRWAGYQDIALKFNMRACWSSPILTKNGTVLGTFALYYRQPCTPNSFDMELIQVATDLARVAIERRRSEETLRESDQRLRMALELGRLGTWQIDTATMQFIDVSDTHKANFGYKPEDNVSLEMLVKAAHPDDVATIQEQARIAIENHQEYRVQYRCLWPDGSTHWLATRAIPLYNEAGMLTSLTGVTRDITERKEREVQQKQALQEALEWADRDPLTGLLNHRAFHKRLKEESLRARRENTVLAIVMMDMDNFKFFNDVYGHTIGDQVLRQVSEKIQTTCRSYDTLARFGGDEFALLLSNVGATPVVEIEARIQRTMAGLFYRPEGHEASIPITISVGAALFSTHSPECLEVLKIADERLRCAKTGGVIENAAYTLRTTVLKDVKGFSMLDALVTAVDNKDRYTRRHSEDVMTYSLILAQQLGLNEQEQHTVALAALLHDVGKIGVPDAILRKPGQLTREEMEAVKQHPEMGAVIVASVPGLEATLDAVRHHHERWDGKGYPYGLKGEETPLIARLMAVADAFSAMTTDRPYRQGMPTPTALAILQAGAHTHWDEACVHAFLQGWEIFSASTSKQIK